MILITGGTGFLGRNLLPILSEAGYTLRVVTRRPEDHPWLRQLNAHIIQADVADRDAMFRAARNTQYVIHAAGLFRFFAPSRAFEKTNQVGTQNILSAASAANVEKLVHVSTIAVAGFPRDPNVVIDEDYPPNPVDDYQRTKLDGERVVSAHVKKEGLPAVIVRGGAFYGPHGRYAFNKLFFEDPLINHLPMGIDGGRHLTFPAYIKDVSRGILAALQQGQSGEIYNIASQSVTHREVEQLIARVSGTSAYRFHASSKMMIPFARIMTGLSKLAGRELHYVSTMQPYILGEWNVSIEKAQRELGFRPTPLEDGVRETLEWYIESGLWKPKKGHYAKSR